VPLNPLILQDALYRLSTTDKPPDAFTAAARIASAYREYAAGGVALGFPLLLPGPAAVTMDAALGAAFSTLPGVPPTVAAGFVTMVTAFWSGATFAAAPPGVAAPPTGVAVLQAALTALLVVPNPAIVYATTVATALDVCTRTVLVTFPQPPPAPPLVGPVV
jgi:hypothetical protein